MSKWNEWIKEVQKFCYEKFKLLSAVSIITAFGGLLSIIFAPFFAVIFPLWIVFVAYVFKRQYVQKIK